MPPESVTVVDKTDRRDVLAQWLRRGYRFVQTEITRESLHAVLPPLLHPGDLLINLCPGINQFEVLRTATECGAMCIDTAPEPWQEGYVEVPLWMRSCYDMLFALRENVKRLSSGGPTSVVYHGANPGIVSHFVKAGLLDVARFMDLEVDCPTNKAEWASLALRTGTKVIHISERDSQVSSIPRQIGEFPCTWCPDDMIAESLFLPAEIAWGTHERHTPAASTMVNYGPGNVLRIEKPGGLTLVRSWVPSGPSWSHLTAHSECMTIADMLSIYDSETSIPGDAGARFRAGRATYRPTCHYAYSPPPDSIVALREMSARNLEWPKIRLMQQDNVAGMDELGVLLMGHGANAWWYGSRLDVHTARQVVEGQSPTPMQVVGGLLGAALWAVRNPRRGVCEPEDLPHAEILRTARPYLEPIVSMQTSWNPVMGRKDMGFQSTPIDHSDLWQFSNFLVA